MKTKAEYHSKMQMQLKDWSQKIAILRVEADRQGGETKTKYIQQVEDLSDKMIAIQTTLDQLKHASGKRWIHVKRGMDKSLAELKSCFERTALEII